MEQSLADLVKLSRACLVTPSAPHNDNIVIDDNSVTSSRSRDSPDMSIPILKGRIDDDTSLKGGITYLGGNPALSDCSRYRPHVGFFNASLFNMTPFIQP